MAKLLEFLARHTARHLFRSSHLKPFVSFYGEVLLFNTETIELRSFYFLFQRNTVTLACRTGGLLYLVAGHALVARPEN